MIKGIRAPHGRTTGGSVMYSKRMWIYAALFALVLWSPAVGKLHAGPAQQPGIASVPEVSEADVRQMLSIAEAQHEIAKLLIAQGRFDRVLPEMRKIYELKLPDKYESLVAQSAGGIAGLLLEGKQFGLAHDVLDEALKRMRLNENKASLLKIQAYIYKSEGNLEKALQSLEKAIELDKQRNR